MLLNKSAFVNTPKVVYLGGKTKWKFVRPKLYIPDLVVYKKVEVKVEVKEKEKKVTSGEELRRTVGNMQNGRLGIFYYQQFVEFPLHLIIR